MRPIRSHWPLAGVSLLAGLLLSLPAAASTVSLTDADGYVYDIDYSGSVGSSNGTGAVAGGTADATDYWPMLCVTLDPSLTGACATDETWYAGTSGSYSLTTSGRELVLDTVRLQGLDVQRRVYVPATGPASARRFARYLDTITNPGTTTVTFKVRLGTVSTVYSDLGSDSSTVTAYTSDGDTTLETTDTWLVSDDADGSGDPSLLHMFQGAGGRESVDYVSFEPYGLGGPDGLGWEFASLSLGPGESLAILSVFGQNASRADARATGTALATMPAELTTGLSATDRARVVNWPLCDASVDLDGDGADQCVDCDDFDATELPGRTWYADSDGDGYGDPGRPSACARAASTDVLDSSDCDDGVFAAHPGATEVCDYVDNDCDTLTDEAVTTTYYADGDADGYCDVTAHVEDCSAPSGYVVDATDCDDGDADEHPGVTWFADADADGYGDPPASRSCRRGATSDVLDSTDCDDRDASEHPGVTWYADGDGDGYGDRWSSSACSRAAGTDVLDSTDCDDADADEHPGVTWYADSDHDTWGDSGRPSDCDRAHADDVLDATDCDDGDASEHPGVTWYADADADTFGDLASPRDCARGVVSDVLDSTDCDDADADEHPGATWYPDADADGWGLAASPRACDRASPSDVDTPGDCDDTRTGVHPGAEEACDGVDQDCDGALPAAETDDDHDGWVECATAGWTGVTGGGDCDDAAASVHPLAAEGCDGVDTNCDGSPALSEVDGDHDGWVACAPDAWAGPAISGGEDCDDDDPTAYPGADEWCDGDDEDCDGVVDEDTALDAMTWHPDADGDGWGDPGISDVECTSASGWTTDDQDCDDDDPDAWPGAPEVAYDGVDQDCDGSDLCDADGDTFDDVICGGDDCDDTDPDVHPGATEVWYDDVDQDCDGGSDYDADGDGYDARDYGGEDCDDDDEASYPGAPELLDGVDNDCDGFAEDDDDDGDGIASEDELELGTDPWNPDTDGDGLSDGDEVTDVLDPEDTDGDGQIDALDDDDDGDGLLTAEELGDYDWTDPTEEPVDTDADGTPDYLDTDADEDGFGDAVEGAVDSDDDGLPDYLDGDSDNDGVVDVDELDADTDGDGLDDRLDSDDDGDDLPTSDEGSRDTDGDGVPDHLDTDSDGDGALDLDEGDGDLDCDGVPNFQDADDADGPCVGSEQEKMGGCGCATGAPTGVTAFLGVLALLGLRRRR